MYESDLYRHQIAEYYNPYVLDGDIQAGEFYFNIRFKMDLNSCQFLSFFINTSE